jgi:serine/threonine-protein kinase
MLRIRTFGNCHLERDGARLDELSGQRKALALLALLAGAGSLTRDSVIAFLWPDSEEGRARTSLKQLVRSLRRQLGDELLLHTSELRLNGARMTSDVADFRDALQRGDTEAAVRLYTAPFLDGFYLRNADGFERWASDERAALEREYVSALRVLATRAAQTGDARGVLEWARRIADADPFSADGALGLMRALNATGERAAAVQHARDFQRRISDELGAELDPSIAALAERLRTVVTQPSVAVLPFTNTSGDSEDEYFSDGLTDELIGTIGKMGGLTVIGRTSSFALKGKGLDARAVADSLHVTAVLEGSVRRSSDRLKIGVQLVRGSDGTVAWSEIYDRQALDVFDVQTEIARAIAAALRVTLHPAAAPHRRPATSDLVAHEHYLKGRYFHHRVSVDDLRRAADCFERAVARDPSYAEAYAGLADVHLLLAILGDGSSIEHVSHVRAAVARAMALDSTLADAHTALASVLFGFDWDWTAAGREFERAIELDPAYGLAHQRYGLYLMYQGRFGEALPVLERARTLDPLAPSASMNLGRVHLSAGRAEAAVPLLLAALELNPHLTLASEHLGYAYLALRKNDNALLAFRHVAQLGGSRGAARLAFALAVTGCEREARELVDEVLRHSRQQPPPTFALALAYAGLGETDAAFHWLDQALAERDALLHTAKTSPPLDALHKDPRWGVLLRRIGLTP